MSDTRVGRQTDRHTNKQTKKKNKSENGSHVIVINSLIPVVLVN